MWPLWGFFSTYLANIFYRQVTHRITLNDIITIQNNQIVFPTQSRLFETQLELDNPLEPEKVRKNKTWIIKPVFHSCSRTKRAGNCALESIVVVLLVLLSFQEIVQVIALGPKHYVREYENFIEWLVILLAAFVIGTQHVENVVKWLSAFASVLTYIQLVFLLGRYPFFGGRISIMFYNITRHLFRSLFNLIILVLGFAFGLFIMHHRTEGESFENPYKAFVKTLIMVLGEYELGDFYNTEYPDIYSQVFTKVLLVSLALIGSLVMVNLFVAIIVSDIENLQKESHIQEMVNKAHLIIHYETVIRILTLQGCLTSHSSTSRRSDDENKIEVCSHSMCRCKAKKVDSKIVKRLKQIIRRRKTKKATKLSSSTIVVSSD